MRFGNFGPKTTTAQRPTSRGKTPVKKARAQILTVASGGYCNLSCIFLTCICRVKVRGWESGREKGGGGKAVIVEQLCVMTSRDRIPAVASHLFRMEDINQVGSPALAASATFLTPACKTRLVVSQLLHARELRRGAALVDRQLLIAARRDEAVKSAVGRSSEARRAGPPRFPTRLDRCSILLRSPRPLTSGAGE